MHARVHAFMSHSHSNFLHLCESASFILCSWYSDPWTYKHMCLWDNPGLPPYSWWCTFIKGSPQLFLHFNPLPAELLQLLFISCGSLLCCQPPLILDMDSLMALCWPLCLSSVGRINSTPFDQVSPAGTVSWLSSPGLQVWQSNQELFFLSHFSGQEPFAWHIISWLWRHYE